MANIDRLTHHRSKTSEVINQNLPRAIAKATFTTSIPVRKNVSKSQEDIFSPHCENQHKETFSLWILAPHNFLNLELEGVWEARFYCHYYDLCLFGHDLWLSLISTPWSGGLEIDPEIYGEVLKTVRRMRGMSIKKKFVSAKQFEFWFICREIAWLSFENLKYIPSASLT